MATALETKLVTYLRTQATAGGDLEMIKHIYNDPPRTDLSSTSFPRAMVKDTTSEKRQFGFGSSKREYQATVAVTVYVAKTSNMVKKGAVDYSAPEQAVSEICEDIDDNLWSNLSSLRSGDPFILQDTGFDGTIPAPEFLKTFDVFKGTLTLKGRYIR